MQVEEVANDGFGEELTRSLSRCVRETDFLGWYEPHRIFSILCTESGASPASIQKTVGKIRNHLAAALDRGQVEKIRSAYCLLSQLFSEDTIDWKPLEYPTASRPAPEASVPFFRRMGEILLHGLTQFASSRMAGLFR
ncbi:MAG TPA: hypothetical protein VLS90_19585 [Thermodesulfobacteriota bacterium]|nr:hypothetical protein [Thermodesulfobacteriota bacterium]